MLTRPLVTSGRHNNFNTIRIAMALLVVWSHSFALYFGTEANEPISRLTNGVANAGEIAVDVFFMVSGFLITQSWERSRSWWSYLRKRVARIYPGYMVATALCAFVLLPIYIHQRYTPALAAKTIGLNLLLQGYFPAKDVFLRNPVTAPNGSLWSIPFEFWCYIGVLILGVATLLRRRLALVAFFVVIIAVKIWLDVTGREPGGGIVGLIIGWPYIWFRMLPCFLVGTLAYLYRERLPRSATLLIAALTAFLLAAHFSLTRLLAQDVLLPIVVAYAMLYLAFAVRMPDAARFGDFSYGSYLYAYPIQQIFKAEFSLGFPAFVTLSMISTLAAGALSWYGVERYFLSHASTARPAAVKPPPVNNVAGSAPETNVTVDLSALPAAAPKPQLRESS